MAKFQTSSNKSSSINFPNIRPSLDLDFANSKTLDPRITFTRSSGGSYVGADGLIKYAGVNQPRFDHDPITGESLGLLIEEPRTNLLTYSNIEGTVGSLPTNMNYAGTSLGQSPIVSTDVSVGSNGKSAKHTRGVGADNNVGYFSATVTAGLTYTFSVYVYIPSSQAKNFYGKSISFSYETAGVYYFALASANTNIVDKWQRVSGTYTPTTSSTSWVMRTDASAGSYVYTDCWQLEEGAFPTSYIPTVASTKTRAADNASITGTNFSSWYNQGEGTLFVKWSYPFTPSGFPGIANLQNSPVTNSISITTNLFNNNRFGATGSNVFIFDTQNTKNISPNFVALSAIAYTTNTTNTYISYSGTGDIGKVSKNVPIVSIDRLLIGNNQSNILSGHISRLTYYPKRLPDSQLQALTK